MSSYSRIKLTNDKDHFEINYPRSIEAGVYKVRSVADVKWENKVGHLAGNDYTYFLEIASWMLSHNSKEWDKIVSTPETSVKKTKRVKIESKVTAPKKVKKMTLQDLFSKGSTDII